MSSKAGQQRLNPAGLFEAGAASLISANKEKLAAFICYKAAATAGAHLKEDESHAPEYTTDVLEQVVCLQRLAWGSTKEGLAQGQRHIQDLVYQIPCNACTRNAGKEVIATKVRCHAARHMQ
eukprot:770752-Pelagomonas_calceolata.AAC.1